MSDTKQVSKNIFFSGLTVITSFSLLGLLIISARYYSVEDFGKISFGLSFPRLFTFVFAYGFMSLSIREIAKNRSLAPKYLVNVTLMKLFLFLVTYLLMFITLSLFNYPLKYQIVVYVFALSHFVKSFNSTFAYIFRSHEKFEYETLTLTVERVLTLVIGAVFIFAGFGILYFALAFVISRVISAFLSYFLTARLNVKFEQEFDFEFCKKIFITGFPFAITTVLFSLYASIDTFMISILKNDAEVGIYGAAYRLLESSIILPAIIADAFYPRFSVQNSMSKKSVIELYHRAIKYVCIIALPIATAVLVLGDQIITLIYGLKYLDSVINLRILFSAFLFLSIARLCKALLDSINKQKVSAYLFGSTVLVNIITNGLLIPKFGATGASAATLFSELLYFGSTLYILKRNGFSNQLLRISIKPLLAVITMAAVLLGIDQVNLVFRIILSSSVYLGLLFLLKTWDEEEKSIFSWDNLKQKFFKKYAVNFEK